jgi:hypothetical protein
MPRKFKKNGAIASVSFGAERNLPSNTEARKRYLRTYPRQLVSDEENPNLLAAPLTSYYTSITTPRVNLTFRTIEIL